MAVATRPWTRADLARLPDDGNRYEVLDGRLLVTPQAAYGHQRVAKDLLFSLEAYARAAGSITVAGPGAIPFGDSELQPDLMVVPGVYRDQDWIELPRPLLVIEVLSPSTRRRDFGIKLGAYRDRLGIPEVWLVDRDARVIHRCRPGQDVVLVQERLEWSAPGAESLLVVDVRELLARA
ncbi:MAG: Uma2 family endonuclease [Gemmatimonadota bacterium]|nr:Uma2 family endonuclease [Gemmatimonadota bacterium]